VVPTAQVHLLLRVTAFQILKITHAVCLNIIYGWAFCATRRPLAMEYNAKFYCNLNAGNPTFILFNFYSPATMPARITHHTSRNLERHSSLPSLSSAEPYNTALAPSEFQPSIRKSNLTSPCPLGIGCPFESQSERSL
jgi:hypothetical protein